jgi:pimeloyl-ACP methyl ester carboxylesterase
MSRDLRLNPRDFPYASDHPAQFCRVHLPSAFASDTLYPVVVIIHGGYWKNKWNIDNAAHTTLAPALNALAPSTSTSASTSSSSSDSLVYAAVEVEYRRRDDEGGGYPGSLQDVAQCLAHLPVLVRDEGLPFDLDRVVVLGHSAGGQLALWLADHAARRATGDCVAGGAGSGVTLDGAAAGVAGGSGADAGADAVVDALMLPVLPMPVPKLVVGVAPVSDMIAAYDRHLSDEGDAVELFMKCRPDTPENVAKYEDASAMHRLPHRVPLLLVAGKKDTDVPWDMVVAYRDAAVKAVEEAVEEAVDQSKATIDARAAAAEAEAEAAEPAEAVDGAGAVGVEGEVGAALLVFEEADHYGVMDAGTAEWREIRSAIDAAVLRLPVGGGGGSAEGEKC